MSEVTLGGDRLGAGKKQKVELHNYERSTHNKSYPFRTTMASGTLVPFMSEVALPGDTWDINLNCDVKTHPTIGPLFGSYKVQLDVFQVPMRLYNGKLQMNMMGIGNDMSVIKIPQIELEADSASLEKGDNGQINPSCVFSYFDIRGLGKSELSEFTRQFNAIPYLSYFDIYAQYYANKQEEIGVIIHNDQNTNSNQIDTFVMYWGLGNSATISVFNPLDPYANQNGVLFSDNCTAQINMLNPYEIDPSDIFISYDSPYQPNISGAKLTDIFSTIIWDGNRFSCSNVKQTFLNLNGGIGNVEVLGWSFDGSIILPNNNIPRLRTFPLESINEMRENILVETLNPNPYVIKSGAPAPYSYPLKKGDSGQYSKISTQEGLLIKTYQSDLFNNWISTEWIESVNSRTAIDTSSGSFTIDTLQLNKKLYDVLNRIAVSGGTYDDWLDAVYTHERTKAPNSPMYMGGLSKELAFQEVISNASSVTQGTEQPLGTLAGRGILTQKHKGGSMIIKVNEPSYIIGIVSLTPRIDYSQGNKWDVNLKTYDDLHKPGLDQIGFESLLSDQLAWWDSTVGVNGEVTFKEVGKQPAWINYMTSVPKVRGNFAEQNEQMFMTLNRRYEYDKNIGIKDLTTYVDPKKFNQIFADTRLDAQNFWVQIGVEAIARRKMSAKIMPNL